MGTGPSRRARHARSTNDREPPPRASSARHNDARDGSRVVAVEAVRRVPTVPSGFGADNEPMIMKIMNIMNIKGGAAVCALRDGQVETARRNFGAQARGCKAQARYRSAEGRRVTEGGRRGHASPNGVVSHHLSVELWRGGRAGGRGSTHGEGSSSGSSSQLCKLCLRLSEM
jgi:hypothetical protein